MRFGRALVAAVALVLAWGFAAVAQTPHLNDLVKAWLASQNVTSWAPGAFTIGDSGAGEQILTWNAAALGPEPTSDQLNALAATVAAQQGAAANAAAAVAAGIKITSAATPALDGTYAIDPGSQQRVASVALYIAVNGKFPAGQTALPWPDINGVPHSFPSTAEFQAFATALGDYVTALGLGQAPAQPLAIP